MGRGEEFSARKKARSARKRMRSEGEGGEKDTAAAKRRRRKAKRRVTESMCYALPTLDDPFLDALTKKKKKRQAALAQEDDDGSIEEVADPSTLANGTIPPTKKASKRPKNHSKEEEASSSIKKSFWPVGQQGSSPIESIEDLRLPGVFRLAAYALLGKGDGATGLHRQAWHGALRGKDVLAVGGNVGGLEGYLAGYLLPAVVHLAAQRPLAAGEGPVVISVVPNRETGAEVLKACRQLRSAGLSLRAVNLHEDVPIDRQVEGLANQAVELVACTPARLAALLAIKGLPLGRASFLVLHAADACLSTTGAAATLVQLAGAVQPHKQALMFAEVATDKVQEMARQWLQDPVARAAADDSLPVACACIRQKVNVCAEEKKLIKLVEFLADLREAEKAARAKTRVLVYAARPDKVVETVDALTGAGHKAVGLHPRRPQEDQMRAEEDFRVGKVSILVTSDATRPGIRAHTVPVLVHVDLPPTTEQYKEHIQTIARTTVKGQVVTFVTKEEAIRIAELELVLLECQQPVDPKVAMFARAVRVVQQQRALGVQSNGVEQPAENGSLEKGPAGKSAASTQSDGTEGDESAGEEYGSEEDDETTLAEEEALGGSGMTAADELAMLESEKNMPVEELLAAYKKQAGEDDSAVKVTGALAKTEQRRPKNKKAVSHKTKGRTSGSL